MRDYAEQVARMSDDELMQAQTSAAVCVVEDGAWDFMTAHHNRHLRILIEEMAYRYRHNHRKGLYR